MVEFKYSIIEYQNKIMSFLKSNQKASQLNLKFLGLKFKSILPLHFHSSTSQISSQINNEREKNNFNHLSNKNKVIFSKSVQITNDITLDNTLLTDDLEKKLFGYIETSTKQIFQSRSKTQNKIRTRQQRESKDKKQNKFDNTFDKYRIKIQNLEKQNIQIHNEIKKIYFDPQRKSRYFKKKIRNMRVQQNDQLSKIDKNDQQSKYSREQREGLNEKEKNFCNLSWTYLRPKVKNFQKHKNNSKTLHLPSLQEDKIQNFYENLYKQRRVRSKQGKKLRKMQKQSMKEKNEAFEELKTRMIHCNINKNFESFFAEKNIRVPEILKNLR